MSADYLRILDHVLGAMLSVEFTTQDREITDYAVVLLLEVGDGTKRSASTTALTGTTRCTATPAAPASSRERRFMALGDGMRAAIADIESGYREMIEGWQGQ